MTNCPARFVGLLATLLLLLGTACIALDDPLIPMLSETRPTTVHASSSRGTGGPLPELRIPRVSEDAVVIDGLPDESVWGKAATALLANWWPDRSVDQRTIVRLLHTENALLVSFVCEDDNLIATHNAHDNHTWRDDCAEIFLAAPVAETPNEGINIEINPNGYFADVLFRYPNWINPNFSAAGIQVATHTTSTGWSVEVSLPFQALADISKTRGYDEIADPEKQDFRISEEALSKSPPARLRANFARWHRPENALTVWSDPQRPSPHALEFDRFGWLVFEPAQPFH